MGILGIAVIAAVIMTVSRPAPQRLPPETPPPATVKVVIANPQPHAPVVTATAKVTAKRDIDLTVQVTGLINAVEANFSRGATVKQGDLLITVDDQDYLTALARAESELAKAKETLATEKGAARQARREWRDLTNDEANDLFLRRPQVAAAEASLKSAQFNLEQAKTDLERTRVRAPFSGQISDIRANLGQYVSVGTPLARLVSTGFLEITVPLTLNDINRLGLERSRQGEPLWQRDVDVVYTHGFGATSSVSARLMRFDLMADEETQVRHAIIEIQNEDTRINPGELVSVNIPGNVQPSSLWLPEQALYQRSEVMTVVDDRLVPVDIKLLEIRDGQILVSGLEAGTAVVVERPLWSGPGTAVNIEADTL